MNETCPLREAALRGRPISDDLVIDVHGHFGSEGKFDIAAQTPEEVLAIMDRVGIDVLYVSHLLSLYGDYVRGNNLVADAMRRYPGRFAGYAVVNPHLPDRIVPELDRCIHELGMKGIKTHTVFQQSAPDGPGFWRMYEYARAHRLPVLGHSFGDAQQTEKIVRSFPDVRFIYAHMGGVTPVIAEAAILRLAARFDNLYLDLAVSLAYHRDLETLVAAVGAHKLLYASDLCYQQATHQIGRVLLADISTDDKRKILGRNAANLFGIDPARKKA